jgi:protein phosphatase
MGLFSFFGRGKVKKIKSVTVTNKGLVRNTNEDNFYSAGFMPKESDLEKKSGFITKYERFRFEHEVFAVFDGMGGMNAGEIASGSAAKALGKHLRYNKNIKNLDDLINEIQKYTTGINEEIHKMANDNTGYYGMGTTFVCLAVYEGKAVVLNTGDSRGYIYEKNSLNQLSTDHTIAAEHLRNNIITYEEAKKSKDNNKLTRFLGMSPEHGNMVNVYSDVVSIEKKTKFLLCSDGLYGLVEDEDIEKILKNKSLETAALKLVDEALKNGGNDNITVTIIEFG